MRSVAFALGMLAASATAQAQTLSGRYSVEGTGLDGSKYSGTATITAPSAVDCKIRWEIGNAADEGTCLRGLNFLSASFPSGGGVILVLFRMRLDGTLVGDWVMTGQKGSGHEELTPMK